MKHNNRIQMLLDKLEAKVYASETHKELEDALEFFKYYNGKFEYKSSLSYLIGITSVLISLYAIFDIYKGNNPENLMMTLVIAVISGAVGYFTLKKPLDRDYDFYKLERAIIEKDFLYDNDLKHIAITDQIFSSLPMHFPQEYKRGNYSNFFEGSYRSIEGSKYNIDFDVIKFQYVNRVRVKNGYAYYHYNRYSIVTNFDYYNCVEMRSEAMSHLEYDKIDYKTGSFEFDNNFKIGARNEADIINFLKPSIIDSLVKINKHFRSLNIEVNYRGLMCISTKDPIVTSAFYLDLSQDFRDYIKESYQDFDLKKLLCSVLYFWKNSPKRDYVEFLFNHFLNKNRRISLRNPKTMYHHVIRHNNSYNIKLMVDFIKTLNKHSDKNF